MEIFIELTEAELDAVAGGAGSASFSFTNPPFAAGVKMTRQSRRRRNQPSQL
jgi:hypothetical protein